MKLLAYFNITPMTKTLLSQGQLYLLDDCLFGDWIQIINNKPGYLSSGLDYGSNNDDKDDNDDDNDDDDDDDDK
jgi:hypothetical protein